MQDAMILWDGLFACDPTFDLAQWICVAMLLRIRNKCMSFISATTTLLTYISRTVIPSDYSGQIAYLLHYPSLPSPSTDSSASSAAADSAPPINPANLLLRQALTLQMSPSPTTGVSIVYENRNLLGIPVEVPEAPPPPVRRRPRLVEKRQSQDGAAARGLGESAGAGGSLGRTWHARQQSTPLGLPEMLARGLLERGESLGINKTVMNAVSELKVSARSLRLLDFVFRCSR